MNLDKETIKDLSISDIAQVISLDWKKPYFGAVPYLEAMADIQNIQDNYICDSGYTIVAYFLSNATTWRGDVARLVKEELKRRGKHP